MVGEGKGWISVYRSIQDHWLWQEKPFSKGQAWIDLLLSANHQDSKIIFDSNLVEVKRGQFITSVRKLCKRWGWSNSKVKKFLDLLQEDKMIIYKSDTKKTTINIVKYEDYQGLSDTKNVTETSQKRHRNVTETSQKHTNNNDNNDNNDNKNSSSSAAAPEPIIDLNFKRVIDVFNQNIHPVTPIEAEKINYWLKDFETDAIIMAIQEAVKNNARTIKYIEAVLNNWNSKGLKTKNAVEAYLRDRQKKKNNKQQVKPVRIPGASSNQRKYDGDELEKMLLGRNKF